MDWETQNQKTVFVFFWHFCWFTLLFSMVNLADFGLFHMGWENVSCLEGITAYVLSESWGNPILVQCSFRANTESIFASASPSQCGSPLSLFNTKNNHNDSFVLEIVGYYNSSPSMNCSPSEQNIYNATHAGINGSYALQELILTPVSSRDTHAMLHKRHKNTPREIPIHVCATLITSCISKWSVLWF